MAFALLFGQALSANHMHDHHDESPLNQSCEVCVLAISDDIDFDVADDTKSNVDENWLFWAQLDRLALQEPELTPKPKREDHLVDPPPDPSVRPDAARAPPFYI